jgi:poly(A) polymerase
MQNSRAGLPITATIPIDPQATTGLLPAPRIISRAEHGISRQSISSSCLKVLYGLIEDGYEAYIVGGGVRDLLLGMKPKDFDIATNATPEQIRAVFRNSRIIGRRFRIVHVHFGREIIEVSTFRAHSNDNITFVEDDTMTRDEARLDAVKSASGMILRDNVYGTIEEDVQRRDFTVNALYYTVKNLVVHDYVDGMADIDRRCLRMIGDPVQRYREDPVRVLRAIRLAAKLDFSITPDTATPIAECAKLLESIPSARLFDEFMKLFLAGSSLATYRLLQHYDVFRHLFPDSADALDADPEHYGKLLEAAFASTDGRLAEGKTVTPVFLLAVLLWPSVCLQLQEAVDIHTSSAPAVPHSIAQLQDAGQIAIDRQLQRIAIPKRISFPVREIWELQFRFTERRGKRAEGLLTHKRFRAAFDFLLLREQAGEDLQGLGQWWDSFQQADPEQRSSLQQALQTTAPAHVKSRRRKAKSRRPKAPPT